MYDVEARRKELNLSRPALARVVGVPESWVYKVEQGQIDAKNITLRNALALAKALKVPVDELLE